MRLAAIGAMIEAQRHTALLWSPVALSCGIAAYFALPAEPGAGAVATLAAVTLAIFGAGIRWRLGGGALLLALVPLGLVLGWVETARLSAPVLEGEYFGPILGRVVDIDRSSQNSLRLTLDRVHLTGLAPEATPHRIRVVLGGEVAPGAGAPGSRVMLRARLTPPPPPVEPGGFDFRRFAWFEGLGGIGYGAEPAVRADPADTPPDGARVLRLRLLLADEIRARMSPRAGGFAAAILTGDRSAIDPSDLVGLRASNLAHLLAISGLHMGLLTGVVFVSLRMGLALVPGLALRLPVKKIAAAAALAAGAGYLVLSGASVATQRAFIMAAVVFCAVLVDRPALTLRGVALSALIVLAWRPDSLLSAGFQMSFAATTALIAVYADLSRSPVWRGLESAGWRWGKGVAALVITSAVAGIATAPYSAFHFNQLAQYGLIANILAVPAMGLLVMPSALLALLLWPLGLEGVGFALMEIGIDHILNVAAWVAERDVPVWPVPTGPGWVLGLFSLGGLGLILLRGPVRLAGGATAAAALVAWSLSERPAILVAPGGGLVGVAGAEGRILSRARGEGFAARVWLENDGDRADQAQAAARMAKSDLFDVSAAGGLRVVWTRAAPEEGACRPGTLLVAPALDAAPAGNCTFLGRKELARGGAHAWFPGRPDPVTTAAREGARPWTRPVH